MIQRYGGFCVGSNENGQLGLGGTANRKQCCIACEECVNFPDEITKFTVNGAECMIILSVTSDMSGVLCKVNIMLESEDGRNIKKYFRSLNVCIAGQPLSEDRWGYNYVLRVNNCLWRHKSVFFIDNDPRVAIRDGRQHVEEITRLLKNAPKNRVCPFIMGFFD